MQILFLSLLICLGCMNVAAFAKQSTQFDLYVAEDAADKSDENKNKNEPNKSASVKTGEEGGQDLYLTMAVLAGGGITLMYVYGLNKRDNKKRGGEK